MGDIGAGKYQIIAPIASGGMAEIFLGQAIGIQGFVKRVAIKRVLPHLAKEREFVHMFLDEARVAVELSHANIVQVLDLGMSENTYFIVMEFVDGCDLGSTLRAGRKVKTPPSIPLAVYILVEVLKGLDHAHQKRDARGKPLGIVHRDVSPPNILISWAGEVKLTDFGIAKAVMQIQATDPGALKGKYSYMSPEQARGQQVDGRSDVFAAGVVLWEMITGQRLFKGTNNFETLERVKGVAAPALHSVRPDVPAELSAIVARALAKPVGDRFPRAAAMGDDLAEFLYAKGWKVTASDLTAYLEFLFPPESRADRSLAAPVPISPAVPAPTPAPASHAVVAPVPVQVPGSSPPVRAAAPAPTLGVARVAVQGPALAPPLPPSLPRSSMSVVRPAPEAPPAPNVVELVPVVTRDGIVRLPPAKKEEALAAANEREHSKTIAETPSDEWLPPPVTMPSIARAVSTGALELDDRRAPKRIQRASPESTPGYLVTYRMTPTVERPAPTSGGGGFLWTILKVVIVAGVVFGGYRLYIAVSESTIQGESRLIVLSNPPEAEVYLNGQFVGRTPLDTKNPSQQDKVHVRIAKAGYDTWEEYVTPLSRNNIKVDAKLMASEKGSGDRGRGRGR